MSHSAFLVNDIILGYEAALSISLPATELIKRDLLKAGISRARFCLAGITLDSSSTPKRFDLSAVAEGTIKIDLTSLPFPSGSYLGRLVLYTPTSPKGLVAADRVKVLIGR
ncbi:MAG: hypothetical protein C0609_01190 [Deltaproteobacteria bacterium]|nr:MAG: hypothetical protein C0609_01190 [Deltaproteobacteria bacterium]